MVFINRHLVNNFNTTASADCESLGCPSYAAVANEGSDPWFDTI